MGFYDACRPMMSIPRFTTIAASLALALLGRCPALSGAAQPELEARAVRTERPPVIDGRLDDPAWAAAAVIDRLTQREPKDGAPATEKTEIRILFDEWNLYLGVKCFDSEPGRVVAKEMRRDAELMNDDYFSVIIDTYNDHRNGFAFATNPLGARRDGLIRDEGASRNSDWDGIWSVKARQGPDGWSAEFAIPFRTLRFSNDRDQTWGINFHRSIARKREEDFWTPMPRSYGFFGAYKISTYGHLVGLEGIRQGERWQAMPYVIGGGGSDDAGQAFRLKGNAGLDLKYRLTPNVMADLTVRTDFAQVESDQEQFNLTRFDLFFPEKREFFLEGGDIFRFGERIDEYEPPSSLLFFSRTIGLSEDGREIPILGGVKVTGKAGKYDLGLMSILSDRTSYTTDEGLPVEIERTNSAVFRLKRDVFEKSTIGVMALSKDTLSGGDYNRAAGFDFNLAFGRHLQGTGYLAKTFSPGLRGQDWAGHLSGIYDSDFFQNTLSYTDIGGNFNAELGFIPRTDIRKLRWDIGVSPRPGILGIRQSFIFNSLTYIENHAGRMESRNNLTGVFNLFGNGSTIFAGVIQNYEYLSEPFEIKDNVFIPVGGYHYNLGMIWLESDQSRAVGGRAEILAGDFYSGSIFSLESQGRLRISRHLNVEFLYSLDRIGLPVADGRFTTSIAGTRIIYSFSPDLFAKAYIQWNSAEDRFRSNFLIRWIYKPGANLYFIYNETRKLGAAGFLEDRAVMLKLSFLFNL